MELKNTGAVSTLGLEENILKAEQAKMDKMGFQKLHTEKFSSICEQLVNNSALKLSS